MAQTIYSGGSANWNNLNWSNGIPNSVDVTASLNAAAGATMTISAGSSYTVGSLTTNDNTAPYTDWIIAAGNSLTSILNFQVSNGIPTLESYDGVSIAARLSGTQGLHIFGGSAIGDTVTISNLNNTIYGPLKFDYTYLINISGKLTASGSLSSNNNFAGVTFGGTLGLIGKVNLQNFGLSLRFLEISGSSAELSSSNGSSVTGTPSNINGNIVISSPMTVSSASVQTWLPVAAGNSLEISGLISGTSLSPTAANIYTVSMNNALASGSAEFYLSNANNTWTGGSAAVICQSTSDTFDGQAILSYNKLANSGLASSLGAGTSGIGWAWRSSTFRNRGEGGTTDRPLVQGGTKAGNFNIENNGYGKVVFSNTTDTAFTITNWLVLAGDNIDENQIDQYVNISNKNLVKDGAGRWILTGDKRFQPVAAYNTGPKPWLSTTGRANVNGDFIRIIQGYLRFKNSPTIRYSTTSVIAPVISVVDGGSLELEGSSIDLSTQVGTTATTYATQFYLNGAGPLLDGALRSISGSNTVSAYTSLDSNTTINSVSGTLTFDNTYDTLYGVTGIWTFGGNGNLVFNRKLIGTTLNKFGSGTTTLQRLNVGVTTTNVTGGVLQLSSSVSDTDASRALTGSLVGTVNVLSGAVLQNVHTASYGIGSSVNSVNTINLNSGILSASAIGATKFAYLNLNMSGAAAVTSPSTSYTIDWSSGSINCTAGSSSVIYCNMNNSNASTDQLISVSSGSTLTISGSLASSTGRGINKTNLGILKLYGSSSYSGSTSITGSVVAGNANAFGKSSVYVSGTLLTPSNVKIVIKGNLTTRSNSSIVFGRTN